MPDHGDLSRATATSPAGNPRHPVFRILLRQPLTLIDRIHVGRPTLRISPMARRPLRPFLCAKSGMGDAEFAWPGANLDDGSQSDFYTRETRWKSLPAATGHRDAFNTDQAPNSNPPRCFLRMSSAHTHNRRSAMTARAAGVTMWFSSDSGRLSGSRGSVTFAAYETVVLPSAPELQRDFHILIAGAGRKTALGR